jgi:hypothetical protein
MLRVDLRTRLCAFKAAVYLCFSCSYTDSTSGSKLFNLFKASELSDAAIAKTTEAGVSAGNGESHARPS